MITMEVIKPVPLVVETKILPDMWAIKVNWPRPDDANEFAQFYVREMEPGKFIWIWSDSSTCNAPDWEPYESLEAAISGMFEEWSYV